MGSPFTLIERIRMERTEAGPVFYVQHPSSNPEHGSRNKQPVIHEERISCLHGSLEPLGDYIQKLHDEAP